MKEHVTDWSERYLTGDVDDVQRAAIDAHLRLCARCRDEYESARLAVAMLETWQPRAADVPDSLVAGVRGGLQTLPNRAWLNAAAVLLLASSTGVGGYWLGRNAQPDTMVESQPAPVTVASHEYLLLLEEASWPPPEPLRRSGYGQWSRLIGAENFVGAQKLTDEEGWRVMQDGNVQRPAAERPTNISGWYIVRARSYEEAIDWVKKGPHLEHGSVLVRQIEN